MTRRRGRATMSIRASGATTMKRKDPSHLSHASTQERVIRAPRGSALSAKSWLTEAPLQMLMNNLDPEVAERPQDIVVYGGDLADKWILTAGLGGMGGAQPLAATMAGASLLAIECQPSRIEMRLKTRYLDVLARNIDDALAIIDKACAARRPTSVALLGN